MVDAEDPSNRLRRRRQAARQLVGGDVGWLVYELPPLPDEPKQTASLVFESDVAIRRVWKYPENWRGLGDDELFALSCGV